MGLFSCSLQEDEITTDPGVQLRFTADTLFFDTIFTDITSVTKRFRVVNDNKQGVNIASIALEDTNSSYSLIVNGIEGKRFENTLLLGNDSMLILVNAKIDPRDESLPFIVEDKVLFNTNSNKQEVFLFSWGQDANFLKDSIITCNATWTTGKPFVIFNDILIDSLCSLTIERGTRIFSHVGSTIFVKGNLMVNGSPEQRILFTNDRFDIQFKDAPGQWGGITFLPGSNNNIIRFATIRNAVNGIWLGTPDSDTIPDLILDQSIIENNSGSGVIAFTADFEMTNCLVDNSGDFTVAGLAGGNYVIRHCTFANFGNDIFRQQPVAAFTDQLMLTNGNLIGDDVHLTIINSIIWGNVQDEIILLNDGGHTFRTKIDHTLLKTNDLALDVNDNILNLDPLFIDDLSFNYQLDSLSPAINAGLDIGITLDLLDSVRVPPPDLGSYEYKK